MEIVDSIAPNGPANRIATAGDGQIKLAWDNPGDSTITRRQLSQEGGSWTGIPDSAPGETNAASFPVSGLSNSMEYAFQVRAVNHVATGEAASAAGTPETVPDNPENLRATAGNGKVTLTWEAPVSNGARLSPTGTVTGIGSRGGLIGANVNGATKVLPSYHTEDPTFLGRFAQEAQTIARLNHPNILQVYDFGEDKGLTYIVSELIPGGTLQDKLTGDFMPIEDVLRYMKPLAGVLDFAHANGILHRDMKPANVLLSEHNQPILADFGLARMLEASTKFTQPQQALGTPEYMSTEQVMGQDSDYRADL